MRPTEKTVPTYRCSRDSQLIVHWGCVIAGPIVWRVMDAEGYADAKYYRGDQQGEKKQCQFCLVPAGIEWALRSDTVGGLFNW